MHRREVTVSTVVWECTDEKKKQLLGFTGEMVGSEAEWGCA